MKNRGLIIGALFTFAIIVTSFTFAYWANVNLADDATGTVTIGEGRTATVTAGLSDSGSGTLVPTGEVANSSSENPTDELEFTFTVDWSDDTYEGETSNLTVSISNISNATADTYLNFSDDATTITEGTTLTVTVTVTLDEPDNETDYDAIINEDVTFDVTFTVDDPALSS